MTTPGTVAGEARGPWVTGTGHGPRRHVMHERGYSGRRGCARTVSSESRWPACTRTGAHTHARGQIKPRTTHRQCGTRCGVVGRGRHAYGQATQAAPCAPCANRYRTFLSRKRIAGLGPPAAGTHGPSRSASLGRASEQADRRPGRRRGSRARRRPDPDRRCGTAAPRRPSRPLRQARESPAGAGASRTLWAPGRPAPEPACVRVVCTRRRRADGRIRWQQIDSSCCLPVADACADG
jgi:hypothetical protein